MLKAMQTTSNINQANNARVRTSGLCLGMIAVLLCYATLAQAALGGDSASVDADWLQMKVASAARQSLTANGSYSVHEMPLPSGTLVRQYVSNAGVVFAVTWFGPFIPDLRQLLGAYFDVMVARQSAQSNVSRRFFSQNEADLVIESGGHQGRFAGRAYLKSVIPAGITAQEIQ